MKVAVMGFGTVGRSLVQLLDKREDIEVRYILEIPEKCREPRMISDLDRILTDPEVELVVDALPAVHPSYEFLKAILTAGKHAVTSNKAALCFGFQELVELAQKNNCALRYEASCGGTIPDITEAENLSESNEITACYGIMNGTTNFILYNMIQTHAAFSDALKKAQELGYAEADPTADLSGKDVKNKLVILSNTAYHGFVKDSFPVSGIEKISAEVLDGLAAEGKTVKLLGLSVRDANRYALGVVPVILPAVSLEANVPQNFNLFTFRCSNAGDVKLYGQGAGGIPTADAMLRDILFIMKNGRDVHREHYFTRELVYEPELLTGTGRIGSRQVKGNLAELQRLASEEGAFFAFEPQFM